MKRKPFTKATVRSQSYSETADSAMSAPVKFLTEHRPSGEEGVLDPMQGNVVYLSQDKEHHPAPAPRQVTQYANYTISHHEEEVNSKQLPKKYRCRFCIYKTSYKSDLNRHLRKHGVALQHCPLCNMPFKTTGNLENHIRHAHINVMDTISIMPPSIPAVCGDIAKQKFPGFVGRQSKKSRKLQAQLELEQLDEDFAEQSPEEICPVELPCHICPFICTDTQVLARHILSHPAEEESKRSSETDRTPTRHICDCCGMILSEDEIEKHSNICAKFKKPEESKPGTSSVSRESDNDHRASPASCKSDSMPQQGTAQKLRRRSIHQKEVNYLQNGGKTFHSHMPADTPQTNVSSSNRRKQRVPSSTRMKNAGGSLSNRQQRLSNSGEEMWTYNLDQPKRTQSPDVRSTYSTNHKDLQQENECVFTPVQSLAHDAVIVKEEPKCPHASVYSKTNMAESNAVNEDSSKSWSMMTRADEGSLSCTDRNSFKCDLCKRTLKNMTYLFMHLQLFHSDATKMTSSQVSELQGRRVYDKKDDDDDPSPGNYQMDSWNLSTSIKEPFSEESQNVSLTIPAPPNLVLETQRCHSQNRVSERKAPDSSFHESMTVPQETAPGRYARLVSDFEEFAAKPYACSLCFFRTPELSELSAHVQNHLTGCSSSTNVALGTACFHTKGLSQVEHIISSVKAESAGSPIDCSPY